MRIISVQNNNRRTNAIMSLQNYGEKFRAIEYNSLPAFYKGRRHDQDHGAKKASRTFTRNIGETGERGLVSESALLLSKD